MIIGRSTAYSKSCPVSWCPDPHAGGMPDGSRGLSAATPQDPMPPSKSSLKGRQMAGGRASLRAATALSGVEHRLPNRGGVRSSLRFQVRPLINIGPTFDHHCFGIADIVRRTSPVCQMRSAPWLNRLVRFFVLSTLHGVFHSPKPLDVSWCESKVKCSMA